MAHTEPSLGTEPVAGIAGAHQSTITAILRAVELGVFTAAEADLLVDRIRARRVAVPVAVAVSVTAVFPPR